MPVIPINYNADVSQGTDWGNSRFAGAYDRDGILWAYTNVSADDPAPQFHKSLDRGLTWEPAETEASGSLAWDSSIRSNRYWDPLVATDRVLFYTGWTELIMNVPHAKSGLVYFNFDTGWETPFALADGHPEDLMVSSVSTANKPFPVPLPNGNVRLFYFSTASADLVYSEADSSSWLSFDNLVYDTGGFTAYEDWAVMDVKVDSTGRSHILYRHYAPLLSSSATFYYINVDVDGVPSTHRQVHVDNDGPFAMVRLDILPDDSIFISSLEFIHRIPNSDSNYNVYAYFGSPLDDPTFSKELVYDYFADGGIVDDQPVFSFSTCVNGNPVVGWSTRYLDDHQSFDFSIRNSGGWGPRTIYLDLHQTPPPDYMHPAGLDAEFFVGGNSIGPVLDAFMGIGWVMQVDEDVSGNVACYLIRRPGINVAGRGPLAAPAESAINDC